MPLEKWWKAIEHTVFQQQHKHPSYWSKLWQFFTSVSVEMLYLYNLQSKTHCDVNEKKWLQSILKWLWKVRRYGWVICCQGSAEFVCTCGSVCLCKHTFSPFIGVVMHKQLYVYIWVYLCVSLSISVLFCACVCAHLCASVHVCGPSIMNVVGT